MEPFVAGDDGRGANYADRGSCLGLVALGSSGPRPCRPFQTERSSPVALEFSRVSGDRRLTLVIDEDNGRLCDADAAQSARIVLDEARGNLAAREGTPKENIGFVDLTTGGKSARGHPRAVDVIEAWTKATGYDAAIWTALESNFHKEDKAGEPFNVPAALRYLDQKVTAEQRTVAFAYIRSAPSSVRTPVRDAAAAKWWPYVT
jgi:hypothetical protein